MPRGGARPNSGPPPDPKSARSAKRGYEGKSLSPKAFRGKVPEFPLPEAPVVIKTIAGNFTDEAATEKFRARELELWAEAWRTFPAAHVWAVEPWRHHGVAHWARMSSRCEQLDVPANLVAQMIRLGDEAMISTRGLNEAGFVLEEPQPKKSSRTAASKPGARPPAKARQLRLVTDDRAS